MTSGDGTLTPQVLEVNSSFEPLDIWRRWFRKSDWKFYQFLPAKVLILPCSRKKHHDLGARSIDERLTHSPHEIVFFSRVERLLRRRWPEPFVSPKLQHEFLWLFECTSVCRHNNPKFHNTHTGWGCRLYSEKKSFKSHNTFYKM